MNLSFFCQTVNVLIKKGAMLLRLITDNEPNLTVNKNVLSALLNT